MPTAVRWVGGHLHREGRGSRDGVTAVVYEIKSSSAGPFLAVRR
jgi:hypothetical protein